MFPTIRKYVVKKKKTVIWLSIIFLVSAAVISAILVNQWGGIVSKATPLKIIPDNVDLQIKNFHFTEVGDANWKWDISADAARYVKKENITYFDRVRMRIIRADGRSLTISGKKGLFHTDTRDAMISGDVRLEADRGEQIATEHLNYIDAEKKVFTKDDVVLTSPHLEVKATGMTFIMAEQRVTLHEHVRALFTK